MLSVNCNRFQRSFKEFWIKQRRYHLNTNQTTLEINGLSDVEKSSGEGGGNSRRPCQKAPKDLGYKPECSLESVGIQSPNRLQHEIGRRRDFASLFTLCLCEKRFRFFHTFSGGDVGPPRGEPAFAAPPHAWLRRGRAREIKRNAEPNFHVGQPALNLNS